MKTLQSIVSGRDVQAMPNNIHSFACKNCVKSKQARQSFPMDAGTCTTKILELVHSDIYRPMKTPFIGGARYFLTFIDNSLRKIWLYMLKSKIEVLEDSKNGKPRWIGNQST